MARNAKQRAANAAYMREYSRKNREEINRKQREAYAANKEAGRARVAQWRKDNPEKVKAQADKATERYREDPEYREQRLRWCQESYDRRREYIREYEQMRYERDREKNAEAEKRWRKENAGLRNALEAKRRAAKLERTPAWADSEAMKFFYECRPAGCHVDHVIPLQGEVISGFHVETNLQWLPAHLNAVKGNKWTDECA